MEGALSFVGVLCFPMNVGEVEIIIWMVRVGLHTYNVLVIFNAYIFTIIIYMYVRTYWDEAQHIYIYYSICN